LSVLVQQERDRAVAAEEETRALISATKWRLQTMRSELLLAAGLALEQAAALI